MTQLASDLLVWLGRRGIMVVVYSVQVDSDGKSQVGCVEVSHA